MSCRTCLLLLFLLVPYSISQSIDRRICASYKPDACEQIARNLDIACNYYRHNVDCLLDIDSNRTHIGKITGEEAFLGAGLLSQDVVVIGEITTFFSPPQTVVIVKRDIPNGFSNLKNKTFCHPGYKYDNTVSNLQLQEFENEIVKLNETYCSSDNITLLEGHISVLQDFFGDSCRPGPWTQNMKFNEQLMEKYSSLCRLCNGGTCNVDYRQPFNDSLKCLINNRADVAVTTLYEAKRFFESSGNINSYQYLCKDGVTSTTPCTWSDQLPSLIVSHRSIAANIKSYLQKHLESRLDTKTRSTQNVADSVIEQALISILDLERFEKIKLAEDFSTKSLHDFVEERRTIPTLSNSIKCKRTTKWCTYSDMEQEKCKWLSQAGMNWGIQPVVECIRSQGNDELSCLDDIKMQHADIVVASSDYAYISLSKGLKSLAYPETDTRNLSTILVVKSANDSSINSFEDLKGKRACIPRFGGKEHLAFIDTTRTLEITDDKMCDYGQVLSNFVGSSCAPGVKSNLIQEINTNVDKVKLCDTCVSVNLTKTAVYCTDNTVNKYFGSDGAIRCIDDNAGDFAVITKFAIENDTNLKVICKNNTVALYNGLNVDENCALAIIPSSEVVSQRDNVKNPDIILGLYEFEKWFGQNLQKPFHLFEKFNQTKDLLFKDSTPGLDINDDLPYTKDYKKLLQHVNECASSGSIVKVSAFLFIFIVYSIAYF